MYQSIREMLLNCIWNITYIVNGCMNGGLGIVCFHFDLTVHASDKCWKGFLRNEKKLMTYSRHCHKLWTWYDDTLIFSFSWREYTLQNFKSRLLQPPDAVEENPTKQPGWKQFMTLETGGEGCRQQFAVVSSVLNDISVSVKFNNSFSFITEIPKENFNSSLKMKSVSYFGGSREDTKLL